MAKTVAIYGIKNCDTMKKARGWLGAHDVPHVFRDYKTEGVAKSDLEKWTKAVGWEVLLNRAGTTFRKLPEKERENITGKKAIALMLEQPSMIKRPVLDVGGKLTIGFKPEIYKQLFASEQF
jgi:arsenate reductase